MDTSESAPSASDPAAAGTVVANSNGWLGSRSIFDQKDERKLGRAVFTSFGLHALLFAAIVLLGMRAAQAVQQTKDIPDVVYLDQPGPGGGGGGSPAPAPPKKLDIPKHAVTPPPVAPVAVPIVAAPPPPPELNAPVQTSVQDLLQSTGASQVSLAQYGGGGSGGGVGPGRGNGVGPGTGGGFGGGAYQPGNGTESPMPVGYQSCSVAMLACRQPQPKYTSEGMRAKIQGEVGLQVVVLADGTTGDVQVIKSLDRTFGLDAKAIEAVKSWLWIPGKRLDPATGQRVAVNVVVTVYLEFRLH